jgi:hypothetical protein
LILALSTRSVEHMNADISKCSQEKKIDVQKLTSNSPGAILAPDTTIYMHKIGMCNRDSLQ